MRSIDSTETDGLIDALYGKKPHEFVAARNELAKQLRLSGHKTEAQAVKKLSKPSMPAWLVNQWARQQPALLSSLVAALDALRGAQRTTAGDRRPLADLRAQERAALDALAGAVPAPAEGDTPLSAATIERALKTARAAAAHPHHRSILMQGRLTEEVVEAGFEGLGDDVMSTVDAQAVQLRREATARARAQRAERVEQAARSARAAVARPAETDATSKRRASTTDQVVVTPAEAGGTDEPLTEEPKVPMRDNREQVRLTALKKRIRQLEEDVEARAQELADAQARLDAARSELRGTQTTVRSVRGASD